jgi:hypothetical protein
MFANLVERQLKIINGVYQLTTGDQKNQQIIFFSGMKWPGK